METTSTTIDRLGDCVGQTVTLRGWVHKARASGKIRGLWVIATNPAHSWVNQNDLRDTLDRLDFLVVQDMYTTSETADRSSLSRFSTNYFRVPINRCETGRRKFQRTGAPKSASWEFPRYGIAWFKVL